MRPLSRLLGGLLQGHGKPSFFFCTLPGIRKGPVPADLFHFPPETAGSDWERKLRAGMALIPNFISEEEEASLVKEVDPYLQRLHYESSHWDDAIHEYRETEKSRWNRRNEVVISRVRSTAFPEGTPPLKLVHVLDLKKTGKIKPHVDSVRFCGNTIAGLSLLSDCVMRLRHEKQGEVYCDILLPRLSLYIMRDAARYDFTHEVLSESESLFKGLRVEKDRRVSVICRNEPEVEESGGEGPVFVPLNLKE